MTSIDKIKSQLEQVGINSMETLEQLMIYHLRYMKEKYLDF